MHIECNKNNLWNALNMVIRIVPVRTTLPILSCVLLTADRDGFRLIGNDLKMSIETSEIEAEVFEKGSVALEAKIFSDIVRNLPTESVTIKVDNKFNCTITSGKSVFNIKGIDGEQYPQPDVIVKNVGETSINALSLRNMIKNTIFSVSMDDTRPVLTGELLKFDEKEFHIVAIDGYRISWRKEEIDYSGYNELVVPSKTMSEVCRLIPEDQDGDVKLVFSAMHIMFELEKCRIVSRLLDGDFLNYEHLFMGEQDIVMTVETNQFLSALSRSIILCENNKKADITVTVNDRLMNIYANTEKGVLNEDVQINLEKGEELVIKFNARFLVDIMNAIDEEYVKISLKTNKSPCILEPVAGDKFKYLVLPINPK